MVLILYALIHNVFLKKIARREVGQIKSGKLYYFKLVCLGAKSFEHANVLSEKNHFSALGGPKVAIFGRDDLDPLHFDVSNISVPPDPPICLNMPKCAISSTFWESHLKQTS